MKKGLMGKARKAIILAVALLIALLACGNAAVAEINLVGVRAVSDRELTFLTGPAADCGKICALPQGSPFVALELENGNGVIWVLAEFEYNGGRVRGYTELQRLSLNGYVPYAAHDRLDRRLVNDGAAYAAPDLNAMVRASLRAGTSVTFLGFEGAYCLIEYRENGELNRGYVREESFWVDMGDFAEDFPENDSDTLYAVCASSPIFAEPDVASEVLVYAPFDASATILYSEFDTTPDDWYSLYYGGMHGYGRYMDFCDLRFPDPESAHSFLADEY